MANPWDNDPIVSRASQAPIVIPLPKSRREIEQDARQAAAEARANRAEGRADRADARAQASFEREDTGAALDPQTITYYAQDVLSGAPMPALGMGKQAAAARQAIMREVARLAGSGGQNGADLARQIAHYKAGTKQLGTLEQMLGTIRQNEQTALLNGQQFIERSAELPGQTRYPALNSIVQGFERATGNSTIAAHDAAWNTFVNEYAKVVSGSPSGAGTMSDSARREAMATMRGNYSLDQKKAAFEQMKRDMENRITAIHKGINEGYQHLTQTPGYEVPETTTALAIADAAAAHPTQRADNEVPGQFNGANDKPPPNTPTDPGNLPPANSPGGNDPTPPPAQGGGPFGLGAATRSLDHPEVRSMVASMVNAGAGYSTVNSALKAKGFPTIPLTQWSAVKQWMAQNPGKQYPASSVNATTTEPLTLQQRAASSAPGAFLAQMGNSALAGVPAYLSGEKGQGAIDAMGALHPTAAMLGNIAGGLEGAAGGELGAGALAGKFLPSAVKLAPRISDAAYGGVSGYTGSNGDLGNALVGAVVAPLAGKAGEKAMEVAGGAVKGVTDPAVQYLRDLGIPMTVGQALGGFAKSVEDKATSIPIVGDVINKRRAEGLNAFNLAALAKAGEPIAAAPTQIGKAGIDQLSNAVSSSYDNATAGANVPFDNQFLGDMSQFGAAANALPDDLRVRAAQAIQNRVTPLTDAGAMTGEQFQQAIRGLKGYKAETTKPGFEQDYRDALNIAQNALTGQMERGGGADVVQGLRNADQAYRGIKTVENAANRADGANYMFTPSQLQDALKVTQRKYPGASPLNDLADMGQQVLPSRIPDSGTAGRAAQMLLATGAAGTAAGGGYAAGGEEGAGIGLGGILALAIGGSKPAQKLLTGALLNRPAIARAVGEGIQRNASIGGAGGAGLALSNIVGGY